LNLLGLITDRIVWICPPSTSIVNVPTTLLSRSLRIAPAGRSARAAPASLSIRTDLFGLPRGHP
jgi:hypothetical protein